MQRLPLGLPYKLPFRRTFRVACASWVDEAVMERKRRKADEGGARQKKVLSLRQSNARCARSISYIQIFGTGMDTGDTSPCVLLFFDSKRFVFNAGEGLQRFCQEHGIKLSKIDHVLLTRVCSETAGGLAGALLTLAGDIGLTINIWGPSDLQHLVTAMSTFLPNASMLYTHAFGHDGKLINDDRSDPNIAVLMEDELVKISAVLLVPDGHEGKPGDVSVAYICELPEVKGKFNPGKATALGVRPGPKYSILQSGSSVLSDDGQREIFPNDVMGPPSPGPKFILVDCPTSSHISSLLSANGLRRLYNSPDVVCIVHMSPAAVINNSKYQDWMDNFPCAKHILAGLGCSSSVSPILRSSARILSKLNFTCPYVFPVTGFPSVNGQNSLHQNNTVTACNMLKFRLLPLSGLGIDESSIPEDYCEKTFVDELVTDSELVSTAESIKRLWREEYNANDVVEEPWLVGSKLSSSLSRDIPDAIRNVRKGEVELVFLGTGSSHPSTYRNVSAIYVHFFDKGGLLLDCGEGTYAQLIRRYGAEGAELILKQLQCIWISHIHADHHGGLARVLSVRRRLLLKINNSKPKPLLVVGPKLLKRVIEAFDKVEDLDYEFLDCSQTTLEASEFGTSKQTTSGLISSSIIENQGKMQNYWLQKGFHFRDGLDEDGRSKLESVLREMGLSRLVSVPVLHCPHAFGVVVEAVKGWKLAYSADTRPCKAFIDASRGSTVFIHEATFEDGMAEEAVAKMHSTTQEAIEAGAAADAYRTILTHFSQRYSKVPVFDDSYNDKTCVAFDLMSIDLVDLPLLPSIVPVLKLLFKDDPSDEEQPKEEEASEVTKTS